MSTIKPLSKPRDYNGKLNNYAGMLEEPGRNCRKNVRKELKVKENYASSDKNNSQEEKAKTCNKVEGGWS